MSATPTWERRTKIRLFSDGAESVIWFFGPIPYERTLLSSGLIDALRAWDEFFYASLNLETRRFTSHAREVAHADQARVLGHLLSREVGLGFEVEYGTMSGTAVTRSPSSATNADARAFFDGLADAELAFVKRVTSRRGPADKATGVWTISHA